jgi:hypothetical protein
MTLLEQAAFAYQGVIWQVRDFDRKENDLKASKILNPFTTFKRLSRQELSHLLYCCDSLEKGSQHDS